MLRKIISIMISLSMPVSASAAFAVPGAADETVETEVSFMSVIDSGACGDDITWTLDDSGTLTISGTGEMWDFNTGPVPMNYSYSAGSGGASAPGTIYLPWYDSRSSITSVIIENGVTSIGSCAFYICPALTSITIPDSVTSIGSLVFYGCIALTNITIPDDVTSIGDYALYNTGYYNEDTNWENGVLYIDHCLIEAKTDITECTIRNGCNVVAIGAFRTCSALASVAIPDSISTIGYNAFYGCSSLTDVYYAGTEEQWKAITINSGNDPLTNATIHYNSTMPDTMPMTTAEVTKTDAETGYIFDVTPETAYEGCMVYAAVYDENGRLIGFNHVPLSTDGSTSVKIGRSENDSRAAVFIWTDTMQPIITQEQFEL